MASDKDLKKFIDIVYAESPKIKTLLQEICDIQLKISKEIWGKNFSSEEIHSHPLLVRGREVLKEIDDCFLDEAKAIAAKMRGGYL